MQLRRRWSICIGIRKSWRKWAPPPDVAWSRILPGIIFERDCWTHTKPQCAWRDDFTVAAVCDRRAFRPLESAATVKRAVKILLLQLKRIGDLILTTPALAALRKHYRDAHITLAVSNECAQL